MAGPQDTGGPFEILAIRYATMARRTGDNFLFRDLHDGPMAMDYFIWVIRNATRTLVVDTGFGAEAAARRGRSLLIDPAEALRRLGIPPETVQDVVLTHLHYDHAGRIDAFPAARFHLQDAEMAYATGRCMCHPALRHPYEGPDIAAMVLRLFEGRAVFHKGDSTLGDGISLHALPGHTPGLQAVRVPTLRGPVVLASDAAHFLANLTQANPFPVVVDIAATLESKQALLRLAPTLDHIVPGHDPMVCRRFPRLPVDGVEAYGLHHAPSDPA